MPILRRGVPMVSLRGQMKILRPVFNHAMGSFFRTCSFVCVASRLPLKHACCVSPCSSELAENGSTLIPSTQTYSSSMAAACLLQTPWLGCSVDSLFQAREGTRRTCALLRHCTQTDAAGTNVSSLFPAIKFVSCAAALSQVGSQCCHSF